MTVEDAKKKWCPFARLASQSGAYNRNADDRPLSHCIADTCMVWVDEGRTRTGKTITQKQYDAQANLYRWVDVPEWVFVGHCGLARGAS